MKHDQKSRRAGALEEQRLLIRALNEELGRGGRRDRQTIDPRAILVLVKRMQRYQSLLKKGRALFVKDGNTGEITPSRDYSRATFTLNKFLRRYVSVPLIIPEWLSLGVESRATGWRLMWGRVNRVQNLTVVTLALQVIELAKLGLLSYLKQCDHCKRWLLARSSNQKFCVGTACKDHFRQSNPEYKKMRRDYARELYDTHKNNNVK